MRVAAVLSYACRDDGVGRGVEKMWRKRFFDRSLTVPEACLCMHVCVCLMCVCLAFRVMLNGMTKVTTPLLASSLSLGRPISAPRVF